MLGGRGGNKGDLRACYEVTIASKRDSAKPKKKEMAERSEDIKDNSVLSFLFRTFSFLCLRIKEKRKYK